ncbi:hypothetical protein OURE66S_02240 [Oligella ureolytica]
MRIRQNFTHNKKSLALNLTAFSLTLLMPLKSLAFSPFVVQDIRVTGLQSAEPGMVFSYLPVGVGGTFTEDQATEPYSVFTLQVYLMMLISIRKIVLLIFK